MKLGSLFRHLSCHSGLCERGMNQATTQKHHNAAVNHQPYIIGAIDQQTIGEAKACVAAVSHTYLSV
jgi:hypothetical protein